VEFGSGTCWYKRYTRFFDRSGANAWAIADWEHRVGRPAAEAVVELHRLHRSVQQLDHVGEVVLALGVGAGQAVERRPELSAVEDVDPAIGFHRNRFVGCEVALLDDPVANRLQRGVDGA